MDEKYQFRVHPDERIASPDYYESKQVKKPAAGCMQMPEENARYDREASQSALHYP